MLSLLFDRSDSKGWWIRHFPMRAYVQVPDDLLQVLMCCCMGSTIHQPLLRLCQWLTHTNTRLHRTFAFACAVESRYLSKPVQAVAPLHGGAAERIVRLCQAFDSYFEKDASARIFAAYGLLTLCKCSNCSMSQRRALVSWEREVLS